MLLFSFDLEITGLDRVKDRITEVGACLWSTKINRALETASFLVKSEVPVPKEVTAITGINDAMLKRFGLDEKDAIEEIISFMTDADAVIGQNVVQFDKEFLINAAARHSIAVPDKLWIDTRTDLPLSVETKALSYMCADHGFLNPFPHNAVADVLSVLKLASMYEIDQMVARAKEPNVVLQSLQAYDNNADAKKMKFMWKPDLGKRWLRVVKQSDVDLIAKTAPFNISIITDVTSQQVWYS
jgi:DNA polymerase III subunit epsilon